MDKTNKNKDIKDYVFGFLLFMLSFQLVISLAIVVVNLMGGATMADTINLVLEGFFPVMGFSAFIWLPLSLICGHMYMKYGIQKALRFTLLANLGFIAAIIVLRGTCWAMGTQL